MKFAEELGKRKAEILNAVLTLADKFGIKGITTKRIASEVGVVEGSLYRHIESKKQTFGMIIKVSDEVFAQKIKTLKGKASEKLKELFLYMTGFLQDFPGIYRIIFSDELYVDNPETLSEFRDFMHSIAGRIEKIIEEGKREREFDRASDPKIASLHFLGIIHTGFTLWNLFESRKGSLQKIGLRFFDQYMKSLRNSGEIYGEEVV